MFAFACVWTGAVGSAGWDGPGLGGPTGVLVGLPVYAPGFREDHRNYLVERPEFFVSLTAHLVLDVQAVVDQGLEVLIVCALPFGGGGEDAVEGPASVF